jgi:hypothetical protein
VGTVSTIAGLKEDKEASGVAFDEEYTAPSGLRESKVEDSTAFGFGAGIAATVGRISTQVPLIHVKPSGHAGRIPHADCTSAKFSHALHEFKYN